LIERFENVATPLTAATVVVPLRVPPPGLFAIAIVMFALEPVFVLPSTSWTATLTPPVAPLIVLVTPVLVGWAV
jgi:hypothetical protein